MQTTNRKHRSAKRQRGRTVDDVLAGIAKQKLRIDTLETRNSDSLDFHDVAVWSVRDALVAAYQAGMTAVLGRLE